MDQTVVRLTAVDLDEVVELESICFAYHWTREQFLMGLDRGIFTILGTWAAGTLVSYIAFSLIEDEMEILNLAVHPAHRKKGLATLLLTEAFKICRKQGIKKSYLDVKRSNFQAIGLYRKFGYRQTGVRLNYYPDTKEDALLFMYDFTSEIL